MCVFVSALQNLFPEDGKTITVIEKGYFVVKGKKKSAT